MLVVNEVVTLSDGFIVNEIRDSDQVIEALRDESPETFAMYIEFSSQSTQN